MTFQTTVLCIWGTLRRFHKEEADIPKKGIIFDRNLKQDAKQVT